MKVKTLIIVTVILYGIMCGFSYTQEKNWAVPEKYKSLTNPTDKDDEENRAIGKSLYGKFCKSCHGKEGFGDGPEAEEQEGDLSDFSSEEFQQQSDGSLFYKITKGKNDMPNYNKKISSIEDRWLVVNYIRTLKE